MKPKSSSLEILHTAAAHKNLQVILLSFLTLLTITVTGTINYLNGYPPYDLLMALGGSSTPSSPTCSSIAEARPRSRPF